jgi:hypothetical protein
MDAWVERLQDPDSLASKHLDELEVRGWVNALQNIAAFLRQGSYLPGGDFFKEVVRDR